MSAPFLLQAEGVIPQHLAFAMLPSLSPINLFTLNPNNNFSPPAPNTPTLLPRTVLCLHLIFPLSAPPHLISSPRLNHLCPHLLSFRALPTLIPSNLSSTTFSPLTLHTPLTLSAPFVSPLTVLTSLLTVNSPSLPLPCICQPPPPPPQASLQRHSPPRLPLLLPPFRLPAPPS
jgi:hypothetical protein